jgi:TolB-like protein/DNA-binding winged helix-turn-helix (wHTH) protein/Tfp pilus assembly protein PilF
LAIESKSSRLVRFSDFEFDCQSGDLRRDGVSLKLQPQPARVLAVLVQRAGEIVSRQELVDEVWGTDTFVDFEQGLNYAIRQIRTVLRDDAEHPQFLETLPKRGYRFIAPLQEEVAATEVPQHTVVPPRTEGRRKALWKGGIALVVAGLIVAAFVIGFRLHSRESMEAATDPITSLAVLPLRNLSNDAGQDYFSEGMTDELITDLAKADGLSVISHTSVERYKDTKRSLPDIARELGVDAIVEGTVLRSSDRVRITAQLIDARSDHHLWAESYESDLQDILALQGKLAQDISEEVRIKLMPQEQSRLGTKTTTPAAYDAYLRGRYFWNQRNPEGTAKAIQYFEQAVREDPNFAPAYSGLADCYWVGWGAQKDIPLAHEYARKALSLQPDLAEAHDSLGEILLIEHQMNESGNEFRRALELGPNSAMAYHLYAGHLLSVGRPADALAENDRARKIDPFSVPVNNMRTMILINSRKYDEALKQATWLSELIPQSEVAYQQRSRVYWLKGQVLEAIENQKRTAVLAHAPQWLKDQDEIAMIYTKSGPRAAQLRAAQLMEQTHSSDFDGIWAALAYGGAQDGTAALRCLERTLREGDGNLWFLLLTAPEFDFLRSDPRYLDLVRRLGLQPLTLHHPGLAGP